MEGCYSPVAGVNNKAYCTTMQHTKTQTDKDKQTQYTHTTHTQHRLTRTSKHNTHTHITCATFSIQVSHAILRSESLNSYFLVQPSGAYLSLSWMMAWNQARRKYSLALWVGSYQKHQVQLGLTWRPHPPYTSWQQEQFQMSSQG